MRNTIPWSLECELEKGEDRYYGSEMLSISLDQDVLVAEDMSFVTSMLITDVIGISVLACISIVLAGTMKKPAFFGVAICCECTKRLGIIVMSFFLLSYLGTIESTTNGNLSRLGNIKDSGCSDEWSKVDMSAARIQMEESSSLVSSATAFMTFVLVWGLGIECGCGLFLAICIVCKNNV